MAAILAHEGNAEVMLAGGTVRPLDHGIVGEAAVDFVRQFKVDVGLIGISGIETDGTLRDFDWREIRVAQAIMAASRSVWLLADHSKFDRRAMVELGRLSQIDVLITDSAPPELFGELLREHDVQLVVAGGENDGSGDGGGGGTDSGVENGQDRHDGDSK